MRAGELLGWGYLDEDFLEERIVTLENYNYTVEDVKDSIDELDMDVGNVNHWIFATMDLLNRVIFDDFVSYVEGEDLDPSLIERAEAEMESVNLYINCLDSHFGNILENLRHPIEPRNVRDYLLEVL